jgi:hypothetical protein
MTQAQLNRAVAAATGESVATIERLGFSIVPEPVPWWRWRERRCRRKCAGNASRVRRCAPAILQPA